MSEAEKKQAGAQQGQAASGQPAPAGKSTPDEKTMATLAHLLALFTGFVGPLIIWLLKKDQSDFVDDQGKEALNFQISIFIYGAIAGATMLVFIGILLLPAVWIFDIVNIIRGAIAANKGERFRYPLCIRLIK
jgi:hypothetical protein